ncbi:MAG: hypothetical protein ACLPZR_21475 [Solirubrobacteraceae bacterium]
MRSLRPVRGSRQERAGIISRDARLVEGFVRASLPRVTLALRRAFGGAQTRTALLEAFAGSGLAVA